MTAGHTPRSTALARHFFSGLFDLEWLSDAGAMSFTRLIIGVCAVLPPIGLLLLRVFGGKYADLSAELTSVPYREAIIADHALLIGLPMWLVAFVIVLVGHAVFPDERDFRILMPLPIKRRTIFGAKLLALAWFIGLFTVATHVALLPLTSLIAANKWASGGFLQQIVVHEAASVTGTMFAAILVIAIQGIVVILLPWGRPATRAGVFRSLAVGGLVLSLPLLGRLPAFEKPFADGAAWLFAIPPFWFAGLEHASLGERQPYILAHAAVGLALTFAAAIVAAGVYAFLYARFDRVIHPPSRASSAQCHHDDRRRAGGSAFREVYRFTTLTLLRSPLHQGVFVSIAAVGFGFVVNTFIGTGLVPWMTGLSAASGALLKTSVWAPFALMFVMIVAARMTLSLPIEPRANWIFRMTEREASRTSVLAAAMSTVRSLGVVIPVVAALPIQLALMGQRAFVVAAVALLMGLLLQEILMRDWLRVPFAAAYLPGKRFVPQLILGGGAAFVVFTTVGSALAVGTSIGISVAIGIDLVICGVVLLMRRRRLQLWRSTPLAFDDQLPDEIYSFRVARD